MNDMEKLNQMRKVLQDSLFYKFDDESCTMVIEIDKTAQNLIAHGVTVREMQKPLTVEEATGTNKIVWYERRFGQYRVIPCDAVFSRIAGFVELAIIGHEKPMYCPAHAYGKDWRCWAEKPTDEERKAAEWCR